MVVVLPAPFGPRKPVIFPGSTPNDRLSTASVSPYRLVRPRASIMSASLLPAMTECPGGSDSLAAGLLPWRQPQS